MDLGTLIGLILAVGMILFGIGSSLLLFIDIPSVMIVFGATIGVTLMKWNLSELMGAFILSTKATFFEKLESPQELIELATTLTKVVQKDGVVALEGQEIHNPFFKKGVDLVMDGHSPEFTEKILRNIMNLEIDKTLQGENIFRGIGDSAPGMGMIGTLIGLVLMLANMSDAAAIGPAMAVALITTLYGAIIAQVFMIPLADKLVLRQQGIKDTLELIVQSILSIQQGTSAIIMSQLLESYLRKPSSDEGNK